MVPKLFVQRGSSLNGPPRLRALCDPRLNYVPLKVIQPRASHNPTLRCECITEHIYIIYKKKFKITNI